MIKITLPDGAVREYEAGISAFNVAKSISEGLARKGPSIRLSRCQLHESRLDARLPVGMLFMPLVEQSAPFRDADVCDVCHAARRRGGHRRRRATTNCCC